MAGFLHASVKNRESRFARLMLEELEARNCPTTITLNAAIVSGSGHLVQLTGQLADGPVAGIQVQFSGVVSGSTVSNADGTFTYLTNEASLGTVHAVALDQGIPISNIADASVSSTPPTIAISSVTNDFCVFWTITGTVTDEDLDGVEVRFGGEADGLTTTVGPDGTFSMTCYLDPANFTCDYITAVAVDSWQLGSNEDIHLCL